MKKSNTTKRQLYSRHECRTGLGPPSRMPAATAGQAGRHRAPTPSALLHSIALGLTSALVRAGGGTEHGAGLCTCSRPPLPSAQHLTACP